VNRRAWLLCAVGIAGVAAALIACGDSEASAFFDTPNGRGGEDAAGPSFPGADAGVAQSNGVVLVHAAAFPPFRLCFENMPDRLPQPESSVMPEANVVGVEVGSAVRIDPLEAPGKIYVVFEKRVRATPGGENTPKCGELICKGASTCLFPDADYHEAGRIEQPLGQGVVHTLAITGCGARAFVTNFGIAESDCGPDWNPTSGSLEAHLVPLLPTVDATEKTLPVQLVHMSTPLETMRGADPLEVTFGALDAGAEPRQIVAASPPLFEPGPQATLDVDQKEQSYYGTHGFRVAIGAGGASDGGAPGSFAFDQSLAEVQELSQPSSIPTTYYRSASNYALILLGDPRIAKTLPDGGANPAYDPRRAVHLLAVPVKEEKDAGSPAGDGGPAGDGSTL
jgi:hypothetical protein